MDASDPSLKSQTVQSNLISLLITGSPGIFSRESASQYYLNVEQISVMHFLDQVSLTMSNFWCPSVHVSMTLLQLFWDPHNVNLSLGVLNW